MDCWHGAALSHPAPVVSHASALAPGTPCAGADLVLVWRKAASRLVRRRWLQRESRALIATIGQAVWAKGSGARAEPGKWTDAQTNRAIFDIIDTMAKELFTADQMIETLQRTKGMVYLAAAQLTLHRKRFITTYSAIHGQSRLGGRAGQAGGYWRAAFL